MIINADDFGYSDSVNAAVAECFDRGLVNRTTIMVNMPCCEAAAETAKEHGFFDKVGLHINLTEGRPLTRECAVSELCGADGCFNGTFHVPLKSRLYLKPSVRGAIRCEVEAQIKKYIEMGFTLMHADSHNFTHMYFSVYAPVKKLLRQYGFKTVRISRNVSEDGFSLPYRLYKAVFNFALRRLRVGKERIGTTKYFGSVQDFERADKERVKDDIEFMTHPDFINGTLTDNTLPNPHPFVTRGWIEENGLYLEDTPGKKIKLLVCFIQAHIGGAMTSLVNFLNALDTDKYEADVMFYEKGAEPAELPFDDNGYFKFFTAARINFEHKGLDRAVRVFARLRDDGLTDNVKWVIAGKGRDAARLDALIKKHGLQDVIYPIGVRENPIPYMRRLCDAMLLPSIHEGKPMAVTEGLIMGLVPIVTRYTSAGEQIQNGVDGLVFDNSEEALYKGLKSVLEHPECLREMREYIRAHDYGNEKEIKEFDKLTERLLK